MHSESCVDLEAQNEEDNESEVRLGKNQQPRKLQNSQILNNLGTKLSHLPSVKRKELAEIINQYREVFSDVPNLIEPPPLLNNIHTGSMKKELLD